MQRKSIDLDKLTKAQEELATGLQLDIVRQSMSLEKLRQESMCKKTEVERIVLESKKLLDHELRQIAS